MKFKVVENSPIAFLARLYMGKGAIAITFGSYVHIYGVTGEVFLQNREWVEHELEHVRQYKKLGFFRFLFQYLIESIRVGYYNNRFEREAREAGRKARHN